MLTPTIVGRGTG